MLSSRFLARHYLLRHGLLSSFSGDSIGAYTQDDFLRDISQLQLRMNQRSDLIEAHILKVTLTVFSTARFRSSKAMSR